MKSKSQFKEIPMAAITLSKHNPRRLNPDDPSIAELAESIGLDHAALLQDADNDVPGAKTSAVKPSKAKGKKGSKDKGGDDNE